MCYPLISLLRYSSIGYSLTISVLFCPCRSDEDLMRAREASKRQMEEGYQSMMDKYAQQQQQLSKRPNWVPVRTKNAEAPHELTITHVNQTRDLLVRLLQFLYLLHLYLGLDHCSVFIAHTYTCTFHLWFSYNTFFSRNIYFLLL